MFWRMNDDPLVGTPSRPSPRNQVFGWRQGPFLRQRAVLIQATNWRIYHQAWWSSCWCCHNKFAHRYSNRILCLSIFQCARKFKHPPLFQFFRDQLSCDGRIVMGRSPSIKVNEKGWRLLVCCNRALKTMWKWDVTQETRRNAFNEMVK